MQYKAVVDSFIGQRFGKDGCMEVVGWDGSIAKGGSNKVYTIKCHECAKDQELHGEGLFKSLKASMVKGQIPCGCSIAPKWTSHQYKVLLARGAVNKNCTLNAIPDHDIDWKTKLDITCNECNTTWQTNVNQFRGKAGCPFCGNWKKGRSRRHDDTVMSKQFMQVGGFVEGTTFTRNSDVHAKTFWNVYCPICSNDEYVKAGVCTGVFKALGVNLTKGRKPCRCSKKYTWTKEQREYKINALCAESQVKYEFIGWGEKGYHGAFSKFNIKCPIHDVWLAGVDKFINTGQRCPSCAKGGYSTQKRGYVYVLKITGVTCDFTGYGISNYPVDRLRVHQTHLNPYGFRITDKFIFEMSGQRAFDMEYDMKATFPVFSQEMEGFRTEATHAYRYNDVISFVKEKLDSVSATQ